MTPGWQCKVLGLSPLRNRLRRVAGIVNVAENTNVCSFLPDVLLAGPSSAALSDSSSDAVSVPSSGGPLLECCRLLLEGPESLLEAIPPLLPGLGTKSSMLDSSCT